MDLRELFAYITGLLRSDPEVVASFFMGVLITVMLAFSLRWWLPPGPDLGVELARRDVEIARKDAELARKDAQIAGIEARLASLAGRLSEQQELVARLRHQDAIAAPTPSDRPSAAQYAATEAAMAELEAENQRLQQDRRSVEADLRTRLAEALGEAEHYAKWMRAFDDENARLAEIGSLPEG